MKQLTHEINLNMTQPNNFEYIYAMQSDYDSEIVVATLYAGNTLYTIDADQAVLNAVTENGSTIIYNNIAINSDKHRISFPLTRDMLFEAGDTRFVLSFIDTKNKQRKSAFPFIVKSESDAEGTLPVSVLKKISEYVAEATEAAKEAKESAEAAKISEKNSKSSEINAKSSEDNAKKYATEAKSYAVGGTSTRQNEDIQNTQYYYNIIKDLFDNHLEQILYYTDYKSFENDYNTGKITPKTLVLIAEGGESDNGNANNPYCINIILADNMTWVETSGALKQYRKGGNNIDNIIIKANSGYYFPNNYTVKGVNGIVVTRNNENEITISGSPTKNTEITLIAPTKQNQTIKGEQNAPTGLTDGVGKINGTTSLMEYSTDNTNWTTCQDISTIVATGTYYVRYKETDKLNASPSTTIFISSNETAVPNAVTDLKAVYSGNGEYLVSCTFPQHSTYINLYQQAVLLEDNKDSQCQTVVKALTPTNNTYTFDATTLMEYGLTYLYAHAFNNNNQYSQKSNIVTLFNSSVQIENEASDRIYLFKEGNTCDEITNGWVCDTTSLGGISDKYMYIKVSSPNKICLHTRSGILAENKWIKSYCQKLQNAILCVEYSILQNGNFINTNISQSGDDKNYISMGMYSCYNNTDQFKNTFGKKFNNQFTQEYGLDGRFTLVAAVNFNTYLTTASGTDIAIVCNIANSNTSADVHIHNVFISYN